VTIIPLVQPLPVGSSNLPGGRSISALGGQPFWRLPIWSCTARSLPGRACHHARRCALTLSPCGPHHFTHHPAPKRGRLVCSLLHLSSFERTPNLKIRNREFRSNAPPLAGSLPFGVRTFLSWH